MAAQKHKPPLSTRDLMIRTVASITNQPQRIPSRAEVLASAYVSDNISESMLLQMPPEDAKLIKDAQAAGHRLVRVYWASGQSALMLCPLGSDMPEPAQVVKAYELFEARRFARATQERGAR